MVGRDAEPRHGGLNLEAAPGAPPRATGSADDDAALHPALGPGVVVAVGEQQHMRLSTGSQRPLHQHTRSERLVIRMRCHDQDAGATINDGKAGQSRFLGQGEGVAIRAR